MKLTRYSQPLWLVSCNRRMPRDSEGTTAARLTSAITPQTATRRMLIAVSDPFVAAATATKATMKMVPRTAMTMTLASATHQYSLRDARPEKFFQFLSHSLTAWTIDTDGRGLVSYTAVYGARPPAYCCWP